MSKLTLYSPRSRRGLAAGFARRRRGRLGARRATRSSSSRPRRPRRRRRCAPPADLRVMSAGQRDRDLQGGRPAGGVRPTRSRSPTCAGTPRARPHADGDREPRHDRGLPSVLDRARPLPRPQRLALEPQHASARAAPRGDRVPDRERHRGRGRLSRPGGFARAPRSSRRSRAASTTSTASTRSRSARPTASPSCAIRSPASRRCSPRPTTGWRWRPSTTRSPSSRGRRRARCGSPSPASSTSGSGRRSDGVGDRRSRRGGRRSRGRPAARAEPATPRHRGDGRRPRRWRIVNPRGAHAVACGLDADARGRDRRPCRLLLRRHEQARHRARAWQREHRDRREHDVRDGHRRGQREPVGGRHRPRRAARRSRRRGGPLRHLDEGRRHRRPRLRRPPERVHGPDAAASSSAATPAMRSATRSTRRGSTSAAVAGLGADCVEKEMRDEHVARGARPARGAGIDDVDPGEFRRYGSARSSTTSRRQRGRVLMSDAGSRACASRHSSTAT